MLESIEDIKLFIQWCKENKVRSFKSGDIQFELSELSFVESVDGYADKLQTAVDESKFEKQQQDQEDDEMLFWSSGRQGLICTKKSTELGGGPLKKMTYIKSYLRL